MRLIGALHVAVNSGCPSETFAAMEPLRSRWHGVQAAIIHPSQQNRDILAEIDEKSRSLVKIRRNPEDLEDLSNPTGIPQISEPLDTPCCAASQGPPASIETLVRFNSFDTSSVPFAASQSERENGGVHCVQLVATVRTEPNAGRGGGAAIAARGPLSTICSLEFGARLEASSRVAATPRGGSGEKEEREKICGSEGKTERRGKKENPANEKRERKEYGWIKKLVWEKARESDVSMYMYLPQKVGERRNGTMEDDETEREYERNNEEEKREVRGLASAAPRVVGVNVSPSSSGPLGLRVGTPTCYLHHELGKDSRLRGRIEKDSASVGVSVDKDGSWLTRQRDKMVEISG
ncbi:hypothetical protein WN48_05668 [Eufriesea mexicana]|nr:hypothetical protein WN48_05668 [Eufriesea mexicana]